MKLYSDNSGFSMLYSLSLFTRSDNKHSLSFLIIPEKSNIKRIGIRKNMLLNSIQYSHLSRNSSIEKENAS